MVRVLDSVPAAQCSRDVNVLSSKIRLRCGSLEQKMCLRKDKDNENNNDEPELTSEPDENASLQSSSVRAFVERVREVYPTAEEDEADSTRLDVFTLLSPHLEELDSEVAESIASRDLEINRLEIEVGRKANQLGELMGRVRRDRERLPVAAKAEFAMAMLRVADSIDAAAKLVVDADESILEGIGSIARLMESSLKSQGFSKMEALNEQFNPHYHEGMKEEESADHDEGTVIDIVQNGYFDDSNGGVLRPARVVVAKKPETDAEEQEEPADEGSDPEPSACNLEP